MAGRKRKVDLRGPLQRAYDNDQVAVEQSKLDVITPEMLASGDYIPHGGRRYYRQQHLDRLHRNGKLTYEQHMAGVWYRNQYDLGRYDSCKTTNYDTTGGGGNVIGLHITERQEDARKLWREARTEIPKDVVGFIDRFLLRDQWPAVAQQRKRESNLRTLRKGLDALVFHLRLAR